MDVARPPRPRISAVGARIAGASVLVLLSVAAGFALLGQHAVHSVDRTTLVTDVVRRGALERSVEAAGIFAPEHLHVVSAAQAGTVAQVFVKPGSRVQAGSLVAQLENIELEEAVSASRAGLQVSRANLARAVAQARAEQLTQQTRLADERAQMQESAIQARTYADLHAQGLLPEMQYRNAQIDAKKAATDVAIDRAQVDAGSADAQAQIAAAQAQVQQAQEQLSAAQAQAAAMTIRAGASGVVQGVDVDAGMRIDQGAQLARIANDRDLKAVLQVPESEVASVRLGMPARVVVEGATMYGRIARIAPTAQNGTVAVDVQFASALPSGARAQANLDASILLARLPDVLSVARPAGAADDSTIEMYKIVDGGSRAVRVRVRLGTGSTDRVQVMSGLSAGDAVIVSDMSNYSNLAEVRLR